MAYEVKPGEGTLNANKQPNRHAKAPSYKGFLILPSGELLGLALWKVETKNGTLLSLKVDDREGEYHAKRLGRRQARAVDSEEYGASRDGGTSQRKAASTRSRHADDLDDDVPF